MVHTKKEQNFSTNSLALKVGPYQICPVPTGEFGLDGGAMFGTVPRVLWEKSNPPDSQNRIRMEARALLLKSPSKNILIDAGNGGDFIAKYGEKLGGKFAEMYNVDETGPTLLKSLAQHGLGPDDIDFVILTHLHFDHCGGATKAEGSSIIPAFPRARYFIQKRNLESARNPNLRERASYFSINFQPLIDANQIEVLDGPLDNLLPHISVFVSDGHTQGQQLVKVSDGVNTLVYCGDLIPTSSHIRLAWIMGYDLNPLQIISEKQKLLNEAAEKKWYLFFEHDPCADCAQVVSTGHDFIVSERYIL